MVNRSSKKPMKGSIGTSFIIEKIPGKKRSCSSCIHYIIDRSCIKTSVVMSEVGYDFYKYCKYFTIHNGTKVNTTKQKTPNISETPRTRSLKEVVKGKLPITNPIEPVIKNMRMSDEIKRMLDYSKDLNYISMKMQRDKYELFLIYDRFYKKYKDRVLDCNVVCELIQLGLSNKEIGQFYGVDKNQISSLSKNYIPVVDSTSKKTKVSNAVKQLNIDKDEHDILTKAMNNKKDLYSQGMMRFSTNTKKSENYLEHCITNKGDISIERLSKHVDFLEKHNLATRKELNKYYEMIDSYNRKQIKKKRKK